MVDVKLRTAVRGADANTDSHRYMGSMRGSELVSGRKSSAFAGHDPYIVGSNMMAMRSSTISWVFSSNNAAFRKGSRPS